LRRGGKCFKSAAACDKLFAPINNVRAMQSPRNRFKKIVSLTCGVTRTWLMIKFVYSWTDSNGAWLLEVSTGVLK
jgi:hypothetical protein